MDEISLSIDNLNKLSQVLDRVSCQDKFYNSTYGMFLEQLSWEAMKLSNEIQQVQNDLRF